MVKRGHMRLCTVPRMFNETVVRFGERRCQWFKTGPNETASLTYSEVGSIVKDLAGGLLSLGIKKQDKVAIMSYNCPEWLWADMSILGSGAVTVTVYPTLSEAEMKYIINDSETKILYVREQEGIDKVLNCMEEMPLLEKVIVFDNDCPLPDNGKFLNINGLKDLGRPYLHQNKYAYEKAWHDIDVWDMATIIYTSGTTGVPKGAIHTHHTFMSATQADNNNFAHINYMIDENDINLSFLPLSHSYERQCGQMIALNAGCTIAYAEKPQTVVADLQIFQPTWFCSVPRIFERIYMAIRDAASQTPEGQAAFEKALDIGLRVVDARADENGFVDMGFDVDMTEGLPEELIKEYKWADEVVFSKVRQILGKNFRVSFSASASLPAELCKIFMAMGIRICEGYGLTETMNAINFNSLRAVLPGSIGPTLYFSEEKLAEDGEILVRGETIFSGYYNDPESTAEAFTEDGFFRTGDIAVIEADGYYRIIDRKKSIMVLDTGKNVPRAKVENKFSTARYIEQICVVGDDKKYVSAIVVPKFEYILQLLKAKDITFDESEILFVGEGVERVCVKVGKDFTEHPEVKNLIAADIEQANSELEDFERIKNYHIAKRRFLEAMDEVTPTMKNKYRIIIQNFKEDISELYKD